jgi:tetratricopeptide (TPR) repeat protein
VIRYFTSEILPGLDLALAALNTAEAEGDAATLARSFSGMAVVMGLLRRHRVASWYAQRAESLAQRVDSVPTQAYVLMVTGMYRLGLGLWEEVDAGAERCLALCVKLGDRGRLVEGLTTQAMRACFLARYEHAASLFLEIEEIGRQSDNPIHQAWGACGQGEALLWLGRLDVALETLDEALALLSGRADHTEEIRAHGLRAAVLWRLGRRDEAVASARAAVELTARFSTSTCSTLEGHASAAGVLLSAWQAAPESAAARADARRACAQLDKPARVFPIGRPRASIVRGRWAFLSGRRRRALACWRRAVDLARALRLPLDEGLAHLELARQFGPRDPERVVHARAAGAIFTQLGTPHERGLAESLLPERVR